MWLVIQYIESKKVFMKFGYSDFFFGDMFEYLSENTCVFTIQVVINRLISNWFYWRLHQPQRVGLPVSKVSWDPWDHGWNLYLAFWGHLNRLILVIMWCVW